MNRILTIALLGLTLPGAVTAQSMAPAARRATTFTVTVENVSTEATLKLSNGATAPAPTAPVLYLVHTSRNPIFEDGVGDRGVGLETLAEQGDPSVLARALDGARGIVSVGADNRPKGSSQPGPLTPGKSYSFSFTAEPGQRFTMAMMFAQSNDLFFAPAGEGIALFDAQGQPLNGDITSQLVLWDAGTEVNQEPGLGPDQAPRQATPTSGTAEHGKVRLVRDQYRYPGTSEVVRVTIAAGAPASMSSGR